MKSLLLLLFLICCCQIMCHSGVLIGSRLAVHKKPKAVNKKTAILLPKESDTSDNTRLKINADSVIKKQNIIMTVQQLGMSFASMAISRKINKLDFTNKVVLKYSRLAFCAYIVLAQLLHFLLVQLIKARNDQSTVHLPIGPENPLAAISELLLGLNGPATPAKKSVSVREYDLAEADKLFANAESLPAAVAVGAALASRPPTCPSPPPLTTSPP